MYVSKAPIFAPAETSSAYLSAYFRRGLAHSLSHPRGLLASSRSQTSTALKSVPNMSAALKCQSPGVTSC